MIIAQNTKQVFKKHGDELLEHATPKQLLDAITKHNPSLLFEYITEHHREKVIELIMAEQRKPIGFDLLDYRFMDSTGRKYYGFPKDMPISIERFGKMRDFIMWMAVGVSPDEFEQIIQTADKAWIDTLKTKKNHQRVGLLLQELKLRMNMVIHTDLLYNLMAVQWIREDENPEKFDASIHDEKVAQFKKDNATGNTYFFFHQPELKRLNELWNFTPDEWLAYWNESEAKQKWLKTALRTVLSEIESTHETKISTTD